MLWTIFVILLVLWLLGLVSSYTLGGFIHILLVIAIVVLILQLISGRRALVIRRSDEASRNYWHHSYRYRHHRVGVWRDHLHQARKGVGSRPNSGDG